MWKTCCLALLLLTLNPAARASATSYSGETVIRSIAPTRIAVLVDTNGDELVDNGFLLTTDIPMAHVSAHFDKARLVFTDGGYVRVIGDSRVYDLQVAGYPDPPAAPTGSKVVTFIGSALMHSEGDSGCDMEGARNKDAGACYSYGKD